jgi:hypothetical protein
MSNFNTINQETVVSVPNKESVGTKVKRFIGKAIAWSSHKIAVYTPVATVKVTQVIQIAYRSAVNLVNGLVNMTVKAAIVIIALIMMYNFAQENPELAATIIGHVQEGIDTIKQIFIDAYNTTVGLFANLLA